MQGTEPGSHLPGEWLRSLRGEPKSIHVFALPEEIPQDIVSGETVAWLKFDEGVQEIFAITVLPNSTWPDVINEQPKLIADSFILPDESLASVPGDLRFTEVRR